MLQQDIEKDPQVLANLKEKPLETLQSYAAKATRHLPQPALIWDYWLYRIVVISLGIVAVTAIFGAIYLSAITPVGTTVRLPETLTALGAAAIGALAGLIAPSPIRR
jgi:hypothetical protein